MTAAAVDTAPTAVKKAAATIDKETLISRVQKYQSSRRFGNIINKELKINYSREQLVRMSNDKIENILKRIRLHLNNRNMDTMFEHLATTCAIGYEKTISPIYDITGFTDLLMANPSFHDALERWRIERQMPDIPPGMQIAYIVASTTLAAHSLNKSKYANIKPSKNTTSTKPNISKTNKSINKDNDELIIKDDLKIGKKI